jgi:anti-sigma-K factor RskA
MRIERTRVNPVVRSWRREKEKKGKKDHKPQPGGLDAWRSAIIAIAVVISVLLLGSRWEFSTPLSFRR